MARSIALRLTLAAFAAGFAAVPALGSGNPVERKQQVDSKLSRLHDRIANARGQASALSKQIDAAGAEIVSLEQQAGAVSRRLAPLERDLTVHRRQLTGLNKLFRLETRRLHFLRRQHRIAVTRLSLRIVELYEDGQPGLLDVVIGAATLDDLVGRAEAAQSVVTQDRRIVKAVARSKRQMHAARKRTRRVRRRVAIATEQVAYRTEQVRQLRDSLLAQRNALASTRAQNESRSSQLQAALQEMLDESEALSKASAALEAKIQSSQGGGGSGGSPSSAGLIWPVSGPIASPFGYRCLNGLCRMHEGIDIAVGSGTPIHAAATGTVIYAGWMEGYGNVTVIDHGGGISTAYAHQSGFATSNGSHVQRGSVIGYVGCTGRCFGPHLHFEVRVNGKPVDPMGYLP